MASVTFHFGIEACKHQKLNVRFFDGYNYVYTKSYGNVSYVACQQKCRSNCRGSGKIVDGQFQMIKNHNHPPHPNLESRYNFEKMLFDEVTKHHYKSLREIYDNISTLHPSAAIQKTWASMEPRMRTWRKQTLPKNPRSLRQYVNILREPRWSFYTEFQNVDGSLHVATLRAQDRSYLTVFGNIQMLTSMSNVTELFIDATFKVVPNNPKVLQLLTIMALIQDTVIPIFWCLMEKKTLSAYFTALNYFSSFMAPQMNPLIIMSDFEVAVSQAVRYVYPNALHRHCYFHYCQAILKAFGKLRLLRIFKRWRLGKILIKKFLSLALLPAEDIEDAFNWLVTNIPNIMKPMMDKFITYYRRQWIQRTRPENFSVYGANNRTNNFCESYHRILNKRFGRHPSIWKFTDHLKSLAESALLEYGSLLRGHRVTRNTRSINVRQNEKITKIWTLYHLNRLNTEQFLACASYNLMAFLHSDEDNMNSVELVIPYGNQYAVVNLNYLQDEAIFNEIDFQ